MGGISPAPSEATRRSIPRPSRSCGRRSSRGRNSSRPRAYSGRGSNRRRARTSRRNCSRCSAGWPEPPGRYDVVAPSPSFVIVGGNLTGGAAVSTLRTEGFDGRIILVGEEPHLPYERPPLSKAYLRGEDPAERALLRPAEWYQENEVDVRLSARATRLDPGDRMVELSGGDRIPYDRVLVATGGRNRRLAVPGAELGGVHDLRTIEDADRIRAEAAPGRKAVVVGAGFIGCEVAASLRQLEVDVEVVEIF